MSIRNIGPRKNADGTTDIVREKYQAEKYEVPQSERAAFDRGMVFSNGESTQAVLDQHDGPFTQYRVVDRYEKDGKRWVLLQHQVTDWCLEVEDKPEGPRTGEIRYVSAERAYQLAVEYDKTRPQKVISE